MSSRVSSGSLLYADFSSSDLTLLGSFSSSYIFKVYKIIKTFLGLPLPVLYAVLLGRSVPSGGLESCFYLKFFIIITSSVCKGRGMKGNSCHIHKSNPYYFDLIFLFFFHAIIMIDHLLQPNFMHP